MSDFDQEAVTCPYCGRPAEWVPNAEVYGRPYGASYMIWLCRPCEAWVGCHKNTREPKGTLAKKELRDLRIAAHDHIDPLWRDGRYQRRQVYAALNRWFGQIIHIGESDEDMCKRILATDMAEIMEDKDGQ